jgi:hypothetical protein
MLAMTYGVAIASLVVTFRNDATDSIARPRTKAALRRNVAAT